MRYGALEVIEILDGKKNKYQKLLRCLCDCGKEHIAFSSNIRSGKTTSCGCKRLENIKNGNCHRTHGFAEKGKVSKEWNTWSSMKNRCKHHPEYKERGILVCERWTNSFKNFLDDMGFAPDKSYSLDRIDNNGHYEPTNCRWATRKEQANNRRVRRPNKRKYAREAKTQ